MSGLKKQKGLKETLTGSDLFIHDETGEELMVLNQSALFIWSLCDDHDVDGIVSVLSRIYPEVEREQLDGDVLECLRLFRENGLLAAD